MFQLNLLRLFRSSRWNRLLALSGALVFFAFKQGDLIEIEGMLNARGYSNFLKTEKNIRFTLHKGDQGQVEETKKFSSGNYGLLITVNTGKHKGEKVWVHYNPKQPYLRLLTDEEKATRDPASAETATATTDVPAVVDPASKNAQTDATLADIQAKLDKLKADAAANLKDQEEMKQQVAAMLAQLDAYNSSSSGAGGAGLLNTPPSNCSNPPNTPVDPTEGLADTSAPSEPNSANVPSMIDVKDLSAAEISEWQQSFRMQIAVEKAHKESWNESIAILTDDLKALDSGSGNIYGPEDFEKTQPMGDVKDMTDAEKADMRKQIAEEIEREKQKVQEFDSRIAVLNDNLSALDAKSGKLQVLEGFMQPMSWQDESQSTEPAVRDGGFASGLPAMPAPDSAAAAATSSQATPSTQAVLSQLKTPTYEDDESAYDDGGIRLGPTMEKKTYELDINGHPLESSVDDGTAVTQGAQASDGISAGKASAEPTTPSAPAAAAPTQVQTKAPAQTPEQALKKAAAEEPSAEAQSEDSDFFPCAEVELTEEYLKKYPQCREYVEGSPEWAAAQAADEYGEEDLIPCAESSDPDCQDKPGTRVLEEPKLPKIQATPVSMKVDGVRTTQPFPGPDANPYLNVARPSGGMGIYRGSVKMAVDASGAMSSFQLRMGAKADGTVLRTWDFDVEANARQTLHFTVRDEDPNGKDSRSPMSTFYLFPRKVVPSFRENGANVAVTLPTGEEVKFDPKTHKLLGGGVLSEKAPYAVNGLRAPAEITYKGSGVIMTASAYGRDPEGRGADETSEAHNDGKLPQSIKISKPSTGQKCTVQRSDVFVMAPKRGAFKYATDEAFDKFLRTRCGFSIY